MADKLRYLGLALGAMGLVLAGFWVAAAGGLVPAAGQNISEAEQWRFVVGKLANTLPILIGVLPVLAGLWLGAAGYGLLVREWLAPRSTSVMTVQLAGGLAGMFMIDWLLGHAGLMNGWSAWLVCLGGGLILIWRVGDLRQMVKPVEDWPNPPWTLLPVLPVIGLMVVACSCPPGTLWFFDDLGPAVLGQQLQLPREWLARGRIAGLEHNVYSYLPGLMEAGYMQVLAMASGGGSSGYAAQWFSATIGVLTAVMLGRLVGRFAGSAAAVFTAVVFLATPWVLMVSTTARDEGAALAFGAAAWLVVFDTVERADRRAMILAGGLLGAGVLAQPAMGLMMAAPTAVLVPAGFNRVKSEDSSGDRLDGGEVKGARRGVLFFAVVVGLAAVMGPYLVRNYFWTGNPVFPMAGKVLGQAHWSPQQAERWARSLGGGMAVVDRVIGLARCWLFHPAYGGVTLHWPLAATRGANTVEWFEARLGAPVIWLGVVIGGFLATRRRGTRVVAAGMLVVIAVQVLVWLVWAPGVERYLIATVAPGAVLIGLGMGRAEQLTRFRFRWVAPAVVVVMSVGLLATVFRIFVGQTLEDGNRAPMPPYQLIDSLPVQNDPSTVFRHGSVIGDHVLNYLAGPRRGADGQAQGSVTVMVGESSVFYIRSKVAYHSGFDADPLGQISRANNGYPPAVAAALKKAGVTHVWVNWSDLDKLRRAYGYDNDVNPLTLNRLAEEWRVIRNYGWATLYAVP